MTKNKFKFILAIIGVSSLSLGCNTITALNYVDKSNNIVLSIKNFKNKSISEFNKPQMKSVSAFITSNYDEPFKSGSNPYGDNYILSSDIRDNSLIITFKNVPSGGPYYAVLSAYDDFISNQNRKNITKEDLTIVSTKNQWSRSSNSVMINNSQLSFSDNSKSLKVKLKITGSKDDLKLDLAPSDGSGINPITIIELK